MKVTAVLNAVPELLDRSLLHCCSAVEPPGVVPIREVNSPNVRPLWINATVWLGLRIGMNCAGVGEIVSTIGVGVAFAPATPRAFASARMFVIPTTRLPLAPGGT